MTELTDLPWSDTLMSLRALYVSFLGDEVIVSKEYKVCLIKELQDKVMAFNCSGYYIILRKSYIIHTLLVSYVSCRFLG